MALTCARCRVKVRLSRSDRHRGDVPSAVWGIGMRTTVGRLLSATIILAATVAAAFPAAADPGPGTFTRITTPGATKYFKFDAKPDATDNFFIVSGRTSPDVTSVDIDCIEYTTDGTLNSALFASGVPVSGGAFSTVATYPRVPPPAGSGRYLPAQTRRATSAHMPVRCFTPRQPSRPSMALRPTTSSTSASEVTASRTCRAPAIAASQVWPRSNYPRWK
jgi:hypothetical protein